jgi:ABC-type enterochelin transport system permease subunit
MGQWELKGNVWITMLKPEILANCGSIPANTLIFLILFKNSIKLRKQIMLPLCGIITSQWSNHINESLVWPSAGDASTMITQKN